MAMMTAIGLMSGTSLDGVDAAVLRTDGENTIEAGPALHLPYNRELRVLIRRAIKAAIEGRHGAAEIGKAGGEVTVAHVEAVALLLAKAGLSKDAVDAVGFHGQTILHRPARQPGEAGRTWQIGDGARLAEATGIPVVADFRHADVAAGGEGAPFAPVYHAALVRASGFGRAVGVINLGGVANITFVPSTGAEGELVAFDCGPGNGLLDEWTELKTGQPMDQDGALARSGRVQAEILRAMLRNPYLGRKPPKSLDRYDFKLDPVLQLSAADGAATLTAYSAACVRVSEKFLPEAPAEWIVCGGGRRNPTLMEALAKALAAPVIPAEEAGWRGDDLEAECFAYLAVRSLKGLPLSFPRTTRVPRPMPGGVLYKPPGGGQRSVA